MRQIASEQAVFGLITLLAVLIAHLRLRWLDRADDDVIDAKHGDAGECFLARAFADRHHGHHRSDAENDAQRGQCGAKFMQRQIEQGDSQRFKQIHSWPFAALVLPAAVDRC